jgi:hypothetical protein
MEGKKGGYTPRRRASFLLGFLFRLAGDILGFLAGTTHWGRLWLRKQFTVVLSSSGNRNQKARFLAASSMDAKEAVVDGGAGSEE